MDIEFKVYKNGLGEFPLLKSEDVSGRHRLLTFKIPKEDFQKDDILWSIDDKDHGLKESILVVEETRIYVGDTENVVLVTKKADGGFLKDIRKYEPGELFTLVATFRPIKNELKL